ncbi:hypothetical protein AU468_04245 [Alkalispirochaeta sphaeroplastigenens]|uniref:histidine kinase n=1 Tax=Alkalispirochaeta sphaeroplastigenens TaxID=1187066 RepID=A0A2S4JWY3_9SPIO|nr:ATP-binding protein [Alkalispirochaeta sphaeroplastigenens]POR04032.1 hypothetical protein AU468_04245 [Alkalispirochaeta sphaeroplastigenens]
MRRKLLTSYIVILLVGTLTTGGLSFSFIRNNTLRNTELALVNYANLISESLQVEFSSGHPRNLFLLSQKYAEQTGVRVTILDREGRVLADSADNSIIFQNHAAQPEYQHALKNEIRGVQRFDENTNQETMFLALPPLELGDHSVVLRLADTIEHILEEIMVLLGYILLSILFGLILAMAVALANIRSIVEPVNKLTEAARNVAEGEFSTHIEVRTGDELEVLARSFNHMALQLERTITTMQQQNAELDSMLSGMTDGALAVDGGGEILLVNREFRRLFPWIGEHSCGEKLEEIFSRAPEVPALVKETLEGAKAVTREVAAGTAETPRIVRARTSLMKTPAPKREVTGVFLLVQDITEIKKLENIRSTFVANVTHELRTPLTLIAGFVETLQAWDTLKASDRRTALGVIDLETKRLTRLINDLLTLSEIENIETRSYRCTFPVDQEVRHVISLMEARARENQIDLSLAGEPPQVWMTGNPDWFRQMLLNLVENGIKYTPPGGRVDLRLEALSGTFRISVEDTGIGIPEAEQEKVFERFYRVEKVRGKEKTGTGLGLTIVQDIVRELGGEISLTSAPGRGSCFLLAFPSSEYSG